MTEKLAFLGFLLCGLEELGGHGGQPGLPGGKEQSGT